MTATAHPKSRNMRQLDDIENVAISYNCFNYNSLCRILKRKSQITTSVAFCNIHYATQGAF